MVRFGCVAVAALIAGPVSAGATYDLVLSGPGQKYVDMVVDTAGMPAGSKIEKAPFKVVLKDARGRAIALRAFAFVDGKLPRMCCGLTYRRRFAHGVSQASGVVVAGPLTWAVSASGDKDDGMRSVRRSVELTSETPPPAPIATPQQCGDYARLAVLQNKAALAAKCGFGPPRWSSSFGYHYNWCVGDPLDASMRETAAREAAIKKCAP